MLFHGPEKGTHKFKHIIAPSYFFSKLKSLPRPPKEPLADIDPNSHCLVPVQSEKPTVLRDGQVFIWCPVQRVGHASTERAYRSA